MTNFVELNAHEMSVVIGGEMASTSIDPATGETVVRDCTGQEIGRYPASMNMFG